MNKTNIFVVGSIFWCAMAVNNVSRLENDVRIITIRINDLERKLIKHEREKYEKPNV